MAGKPGVMVAVDQKRQNLADRDVPAGLRVFNPERLESTPADPAEFLAKPGSLEKARAVLEMKRDERVSVAAALRAGGAKPGRIAQLLGVSLNTVRNYLTCAREQGGLDDVLRDIEYRHIPQAVDNLGRLLERGDKDATFETLKGRGIFRTFGNTKAEGAGGSNSMQVQVNFVGAPDVPTTDPLKQVAGSTGEIVGKAND